MANLCYILVGLPGSGKTTWLNSIDLDKSETSHVLSTDDIVEEILESYGISDFYTYSDAWPDLIGFATKEFNRLLNFYSGLADDSNLELYIDRTNLTKASRKLIMDTLGPNWIYHVELFHLPDADTWDRRLASRPDKVIPKDVLDRMLQQFEPPEESEGFRMIWDHTSDGGIDSH